MTPAALIMLSLSCSEMAWRGRVLLAGDWLTLDAVRLTPGGFTATGAGSVVTGVTHQAGGMSISLWNVGLTRLPDGLPF